jgi:hypothetical protein
MELEDEDRDRSQSQSRARSPSCGGSYSQARRDIVAFLSLIYIIYR